MRHYCQEGQYNDLASIISNSNEHTVLNLLKVGDPGLLSLLAIAVFFIYYLFGAGYTAGCGVSSGLFVPMVVIGAAYGRIVGLILGKVYGSQFTDAGIFAIMGTAAFMAGVSRLTVSLTVIVIEITNDLANLLPIMLAVMTAKLIADLINHPLFDSQIAMKHIPYLEPNPVKEMKILMCKHIMARRPKFFTEKDNVGNIMTVRKM
jgi:chloride channel 7